MPKMKTKRAAAKRFKLTGTGKLMRFKANKRHILTKKSTKRKRNLRKPILADATNIKTMKKICEKETQQSIKACQGLQRSQVQAV